MRSIWHTVDEEAFVWLRFLVIFYLFNGVGMGLCSMGGLMKNIRIHGILIFRIHEFTKFQFLIERFYEFVEFKGIFIKKLIKSGKRFICAIYILKGWHVKIQISPDSHEEKSLNINLFVDHFITDIIIINFDVFHSCTTRQDLRQKKKYIYITNIIIPN